MYDRAKIREKIAAANEKKPFGGKEGFKSDKWFPPKEGKKTIRLFDPTPEKNSPFFDLWFHYKIGGKTILCLEKNFGLTCPVCEEGRKLGKSQLAEDKKLGKKLFAQQRFFAWMVDRDENPMTPKVWGFSKTIYNKLMGMLDDDEYQNFLDPLVGLDLVVETQKVEGKAFVEPIATPRRKESRLAATDEEIKRIVSDVKPVEEIFKRMNEIQIRKAIEDWLNFTPEDNLPETDGVVKGAEKQEPKTEDIDKAFDDACLDDI